MDLNSGPYWTIHGRLNVNRMEKLGHTALDFASDQLLSGSA